MDAQKAADHEDEITMRRISRKPQVPKANIKNYDIENERMGVTSALDLILSESQKFTPQEARHKFEAELFGFSQDKVEIQKAKETKFLTIKGLLDHPYFMEINEADISQVIDDFEKFENYRN